MAQYVCSICSYVYNEAAGIAELFLKTAANEKEHAELWFKALGEVGDTAGNLLRWSFAMRVN